MREQPEISERLSGSRVVFQNNPVRECNQAAFFEGARICGACAILARQFVPDNTADCIAYLSHYMESRARGMKRTESCQLKQRSYGSL